MEFKKFGVRFSTRNNPYLFKFMDYKSGTGCQNKEFFVKLTIILFLLQVHIPWASECNQNYILSLLDKRSLILYCTSVS